MARGWITTLIVARPSDGIAFVDAPARRATRHAAAIGLALAIAALLASSASAQGDHDGAPNRPRARRAVDLFPRAELGRAAGWYIPPEPAPDTREGEAERNADALLDDGIAEDRLHTSDAWYQELAREMRRRFRPSQSEVESDRRRGMAPWQVLYDELRRHAPGPERPIDVPGQPLPEQRLGVRDPTDRGDPHARWLERTEWCNALNSPVTWYRVDLRVIHNPEGELSAAWVLRSSGIPALDEAALRAVREGSVAIAAPPARIVGERQAVRSDWAFEMGDVATPLACLTDGGGATGEVMCVDDPLHGTMCSVLGRGIVRTRLRLLRVEDALHPGARDRRARRRRDRDRPRP